MSSVPLEQGELHTVQVADPAAATDASFTLPANFRYRVLGVTFKLTTDANAADRAPNLTMHDPSGMQRYFVSEFTIPASLGINLLWASGLGYQTPDANSRMTLGLPTNLLLNAGVIIKTEIALIQAADTVTLFKIFFSRWPMQTE